VVAMFPPMLRLEHEAHGALAQLVGVLLETGHRWDLLLSPGDEGVDGDGAAGLAVGPALDADDILPTDGGGLGAAQPSWAGSSSSARSRLPRVV
jgi:hypothetical protein